MKSPEKQNGKYCKQ